MITVVQYLSSKYKVVVPTTLSKSEAVIFGIPYPLKPNWLEEHGGTVIDGFMKARLIQSLIAKNDRFAESAFQALGETMPSHPFVTKADRKHKAKVAKKAAKVRALAEKLKDAALEAKNQKVSRVSVAGNVDSDDFLRSFEWRRVRMMALKKYGARCQCCGASPATGAVMNVDHIKPRKLFPALALDVDNLQVLCHECNHGKGNWDMTDWRKAKSVD